MRELDLCGQVPPQAIDAEKAVLGALLLERDTFDNISGILTKQSFYDDKNALLFGIIEEMKKVGTPTDLVTVTTELKNRNLFEKITPLYITQLTSGIASAAHIEAHARIIAEKYYLRETINRATKLIQKCYNGADVDEVASDWKQSVENLESVFTVSDTGTIIKDVLKNTLREIEQDCINAKEKKTPGITTGFKSLNFNTGGWRNGNLIVLAARPGIGKTSFALHFALEAAKAGYWVNVFSFEMNKEDLNRIILSGESGVNRSNIRDGYLNNDDWKNIHGSLSAIENLPIIFRDTAGMNVDQVQSAIRRNRKNGCCDIVIVDYLQLMKSASSKVIRELEVSEMSRTLKTTALAENIPIMALSQLNRAADGETPKLSNLRESGAIEQDADLVMFLHRPGDTDNSIIRLTIAKHRRGRLGEFDIHANDQMTRFKEFSTTGENQKTPF